jgi:hypothetical protein
MAKAQRSAAKHSAALMMSKRSSVVAAAVDS